jgi:FKBP-type peptidyl-prolyl cis-trans isomerase 2
MSARVVPGDIVTHPDRPDWGEGQVQSVIGNRVTVNFEHAGKLLINTDVVALVLVESEDDRW